MRAELDAIDDAGTRQRFARSTAWAAFVHGYDLCTRLGIKAGTMYPILMRLADRGHVETTWETDAPRGRPPRHLYRLSTAGGELVTDLTAKSATAPVDRAAPVARSRRPATGMTGT